MTDKNFEWFDKNGNRIEMPADGIARDGMSMRVRMTLCDAAATSVPLYDGLGRTAGQRPGFGYVDKAHPVPADFAAADAANDAYASWLSNAWRGGAADAA